MCRFATSPPGGWCLVPPSQEDIHGPACSEGTRTDVRLCKLDCWACRLDNGSDGGSDVVPSDMLPLDGLLEA